MGLAKGLNLIEAFDKEFKLSQTGDLAKGLKPTQRGPC